MLRLMNLTNHPKDLARFGSCPKQVQSFLDKHQLHGLEVMIQDQWSEEALPKSLAKGVHMCFWPIWLDYWQGHKTNLMHQFKTEEAIRQFYGGCDRSAMVAWYRQELKAAAELGAVYVVFHVSHVSLEDSYTYAFSYTDQEVVEAFIELINEVFEGFEGSLQLLMENQWWPGLTFLDATIMERLLDGIHYPHKGFMLDVGHMMNTNRVIKTEEEAVAYMLSVLEGLGTTAKHIRGMHLNSSLSGAYVTELLERGGNFKHDNSFMDQYMDAFGHIAQIDRHEPFASPSIQQILKVVNPAFLVHEFTVQDVAKLDQYLSVQNAAIGLDNIGTIKK